MITVIVVYSVLNFIIQSVLQPTFVGDAAGRTTTMSFLSLIIWAYILGPIGAVMAIPASLLVAVPAAGPAVDGRTTPWRCPPKRRPAPGGTSCRSWSRTPPGRPAGHAHRRRAGSAPPRPVTPAPRGGPRSVGDRNTPRT